MGLSMSEIKIWGALIVSIIGLFLTIYQSYLNATRRKDDKAKGEEDRKTAISLAIQEVRNHADMSIEKTDKNIEEIRGIIADIKTQIMEQRTKIELFWRCIETNLGALLKTYPSQIDKDLLITKMTERKLSLEEAEKLKEILLGEMEATKKEDKPILLVYIIAIAGLTQIIYDLEKKGTTDSD